METTKILTLQEAADLLNCKSIEHLKGHCQVHEVQIYSGNGEIEEYVFKVDISASNEKE